jgi:HD superfamily phosphohydrolase
MKFVSSIRDPVYGLVPITEIEQEILKLPIMNRLKNIKQLGLAYLAFPGANHTRFEHSIGTMHVAHLIATGIEVEDPEIEMVRIAALLHDVGHPPFSHSIEFASRLYDIKEIPDHKTVTKNKIVEDAKLQDILIRKPIVHLEDVANLAVGKFTKAPYLSQIVDSGVDADKIDYILRDNHHCGFPVALDINTLSQVFSKNKLRGIVVKSEGQSFAEQLFIGRYHLVYNIHHNVKNRLGNYLLAWTLEEAWKNTTDKEKIATEMTRNWNDGDLINYLKEKAPKRYEVLRDHLLGVEAFCEIHNFGYEELTPLARYSAAFASFKPHFLPEISKAFNKWIKDKEFFVDTYVANPPEPSVVVGEDNPHYLIDTPLSKAALDASLKDVHVAIYSPNKISQTDIDMDKLLEEYRRTLDSSLNMEKAESLIKSCWKEDKSKFCVHKLIELVLNDRTIVMRQKEDFTSDIVLVTTYALYESFVKILKEVVFIKSLSELARILNDLKTQGYFKRTTGSDMNSYEIPKSGTSGFNFPATFFVDIEMLETFGLLYRIIKVKKFGERFQEEYQLRISGWGRDYFRRNLSCVHDLLNLSKRLEDYFDGLLKKSQETYVEYFKKVREESETGQTTSEETKALAKKLPIKVMV